MARARVRSQEKRHPLPWEQKGKRHPLPPIRFLPLVGVKGGGNKIILHIVRRRFRIRLSCCVRIRKLKSLNSFDTGLVFHFPFDFSFPINFK